MKKMTCNELGGACNLEFQANTFDEMAELSKKHGTEMFHKGDVAHLRAIATMRELMNTPEAMQKWFQGKREEFEALPEL